MSVDDFLELVLRSRLMDFSTLRKRLDRAPQESYGSPQRMAQWLEECGCLTRYQATNLLRGTWRGLVVDHYEIAEFLGKGGMGNVYLATDRNTGRSYAMKVLRPKLRHKDRSVLRFRREMQVSGNLQHPGIAEACKNGIWKGIHYLLMEYVPGPTLYRLVRQQGPVHPYWASRWLGEVAAALDYAHQAGVVHRDLKPSNVIITTGATAKLLDLGLARWYDDDHNESEVLGENRIVGSFDYIAPEQAVDSARADGRSDIYGMGCLLYFALAGRPPFHKVAGSEEKIAHHLRVTPKSLLEIRPELSAELVAIVERMMAKDPRQRHAVAAEVRDQLSGWCGSWLAHSPIPPPFESPKADVEAEEVPSRDDPAVIDETTEGSESRSDPSAVSTDPRSESRFWTRMGAGLSRWLRADDRDPNIPSQSD